MKKNFNLTDFGPFLTRHSHSLPAFHPQYPSSQFKFLHHSPFSEFITFWWPKNDWGGAYTVALYVIHCSNTSLETGRACTASIETPSKHWWLQLSLGRGMPFNIIDICTSRCSQLLNLSRNVINSILPVYGDLFYRNTIYCTSTIVGTGSIIPVPKGC